MSAFAERDPAAPHRDGCPLSEGYLDPNDAYEVRIPLECICLDLAWEDEPDPDREYRLHC